PNRAFLPRVRQRREVRLDLSAQVLRGRRQRQTLPEVLLRLVGRESRAHGGDLEQHSARLPEVDRAEVEAVDHWSRVAAAFDDAVAPRDVVLQRRGPGDVVDGAGATQAPGFGGGIVNVERAARIAPGLVRVRAGALEAQRVSQELVAGTAPALKSPNAGKALEGELLGNLGMARDEWRILGRCSDELESEPLRIIEAETVTLDRGLEPGWPQPLCPEPERGLRSHAKANPVDHPGACTAPHQAWIFKEGEVGPGASVLVRVEEVVDGGVVLVDRLLDQAHAHDAGVEADILGCVGRDRADVMDAVELFHCHRFPTRVLPSFVPGVTDAPVPA